MVARLWRLLDWLFPARCVSCGALGGWWCSACEDRVVRITSPTCPRCNRLTSRGEHCRTCRRHVELTGILAGAHYRPPLTAAIRALKYRHAKALIPDLVGYQIIALARLQRLRHAMLIPVPLHPSRLRSRGHNQAVLLTAAVSHATGIPVADGLRRVRDTPSQTGLNRRQRQSNVAEAFRWDGPPLNGRLIVLVDDVVTTGATLNACVRPLRRAGAAQVWGLVVAKR